MNVLFDSDYVLIVSLRNVPSSPMNALSASLGICSYAASISLSFWLARMISSRSLHSPFPMRLTISWSMFDRKYYVSRFLCLRPLSKVRANQISSCLYTFCCPLLYCKIRFQNGPYHSEKNSAFGRFITSHTVIEQNKTSCRPID